MKHEALIAFVKRTTDDTLKRLKDTYVGKEVVLVCPGSAGCGRTAVITDIEFRNGVPYFLCMVTRSNTFPEARMFLNSAGWTRAYRTLNEFAFVEEHL